MEETKAGHKVGQTHWEETEKKKNKGGIMERPRVDPFNTFVTVWNGSRQKKAVRAAESAQQLRCKQQLHEHHISNNHKLVPLF